MDLQERTQLLERIDRAFRVHPVVALLGPRQCGKTTLARMVVERNSREEIHYFDLENPEDFLLFENPKLLLAPLKGLIVIDEVQRVRELFPLIRVLVDDPKGEKKFLLLGSASRDLIHQSSETLAGRIHHIEITPFSQGEVRDGEKLWLRGGFPRSYLANTVEGSESWRKEYIATFLERDIPNLGFNIPAGSLRRFWTMITAVHGNIFNASEIGRSLGLSGPTMRRYLDLLVGTFMLRELQPWFENISKRQVKSPKIYFRDSGLLHTLLGAPTKDELLRHPKLGASWEGFAMESVIRSLELSGEECFFWAVHGQAEIDLLTFQGTKRIGYEFKWADAPRLTPSLVQAKEILKLDETFVIYPGEKIYPLAEGIQAIGLKRYLDWWSSPNSGK